MDVDEAFASDYAAHMRVGAGPSRKRALKLMPEGGSCGLHWDLCPNMCTLQELLPNKFTDIVGNKMKKYAAWHAEIEMKKYAIQLDLEGKLDQVAGNSNKIIDGNKYQSRKL